MAATGTNRTNDPLGLVGSVVAEKYEVLGLAGEGGFSVVYKARHLIWQQLVAIKFFVVLEDAPANVRERLLDDFIREGKLMSELSSRSAAIVQARDIGKLQHGDGWIPYMVLEWLEGHALDHVLADEYRAGTTPRTLAESLALLEPVATALEFAHRSNVAHRDLKPANIMVTGKDGFRSCKLLDFGIAKVMGEQLEHPDQLKLTGQQITAFTPNYGAPEQFSRQFGATGPWTDVFAMALILIEMLRGGLRALDGGTFFELGVASSNPVRPTPKQFGIDLGPELEAVFERALAIQPKDRFASMGELWSELHRAAATDPAAVGLAGAAPSVIVTGSARVPSGFASISIASVPRYLQPGQTELAPSPLAATTASPVSTLSSARSSTPVTRKGVPVAAVVAVAAAALAAGAFLATRRNDAPTSQPSPHESARPSLGATPTASATAVAARADEGPCPRGMKPVPGGTFTMGSNDAGFPLWKPAHKVTLDTFCLDVHEVTVADYRSCVKGGACKPADTRPNFPKGESESDEAHAKFVEAAAEFCNAEAEGRDEHPINCVDWYRADAYCRAQGGKLPTEAQWELAARGTDGRKFPWGDDAGDHTYMNAAGTEWRDWLKGKALPAPDGLMYEKSDGFAGTAPVGRFPRAQTQSGQLDMIGNVWEWTSDWYGLYSADAETNPKGPGAGDRKAIRGGGFNGEFTLWVNPAARYHQLATASAHVIGFRCAANVRPAR